MSKFWTAVLAHLGIQSTPSTEFHPQTDGQVERINAFVEDYLRSFCATKQDDWSCWLPVAEFSYNNTPSSSTKFTPFFTQQGFQIRFNYLVASSGVPAAETFVQHLQDIHSSLIISLTKAKEAQCNFYNGDRRVSVSYLPGYLVWLLRRDIKTKRPNSKHDVQRLGPFAVI